MGIEVLTDYDIESVCTLWGDVFGKDEADMERVQIDGSECEYNEDTVFCAVENNRLIGTVHITIPENNRIVAGVSGVCCSAEARGKGIAKMLMAKAMECLRDKNVHFAFLGTENPIAAKLYFSFGFSYMAGSCVMVSKLTDKGCMSDIFSGAGNDIKIVKGTPGFRIPLIPLINLNEELIIADINAGIMGRSFFAQNSCMGLYPKYEKVCLNGGQFFGGVDANGTLGAIATVLPTDAGARMDVCIADSFVPCFPEMIRTCEEQFGQVYFQISAGDKKKQMLVEKIGFKMQKTVMHSINDFCVISTGIWTR